LVVEFKAPGEKSPGLFFSKSISKVYQGVADTDYVPIVKGQIGGFNDEV